MGLFLPLDGRNRAIICVLGGEDVLRDSNHDPSFAVISRQAQE